MSSLISCDVVLNRSKIPVPRGTSIFLQFLGKIRQNSAKIHEDRTKTASQLINELTSELTSRVDFNSWSLVQAMSSPLVDVACTKGQGGNSIG